MKVINSCKISLCVVPLSPSWFYTQLSSPSLLEGAWLSRDSTPIPLLRNFHTKRLSSLLPSPMLGTHDFHVKRLLSNLNKTHFAGREMGRESLQMKVMRLQARKEMGWQSLRIKSYALHNNKNDEKKILKKIFVFKAENL